MIKKSSFLNFYAMLKIILSAAIFVICVFLGKKLIKKARVFLPSGKRVPEDKQLICLSVGELMGLSKKDLAWLENYVMTKNLKDVSWDDVMRRIDIALNEF
jgi:hypothetical protein